MDLTARIRTPRPTPSARLLVPLLALLAAAVGYGWLAASPAAADATFVVTSTADTGDAQPGDAVCATEAGECTLRAAIEEANATAGLDTIRFDLGGGASISPGSELPPVTGPAVIDAPGASVTLDGSAAGAGAAGLRVLGGDSTVRGLRVQGFDGPSLVLADGDGNAVTGSVLDHLELTDGSDGNTIGVPDAGNEIGLLGIRRGVEAGSSFNTVQGNTIRRIEALESAGNQIGGLAPGEGNTVTDGIRLARSYSDVVAGNLIGTDGTQALGSGIGLQVFGSGTEIVGNVISGNAGDGIDYSSDAPGSVSIRGNLIGTDASGMAPLPNGGAGVRVSAGGHDVRIGGTEAGAANVIAYNGGAGVLILDIAGAATGNTVLGNSIFANGGLGIDLGALGVTPNDPGDVDDGFEGTANNLQNFPVIDAEASDLTRVSGILDSQAGSAYRIEVFANAEPDPSGYGEGARFLGATTIDSHPGGEAPFLVDLPEGAVEAGEWVTATATNLATGDTSEFSAAVQLDGQTTPPPGEPGGGVPLALLVSTSPDRAAPAPLDGAVLDGGEAYVFVPDLDAPDGVDFVAFFLDDPDQSGLAYQVENLAAFDLAGTAGDGSARPFDLETLEPGVHTVTAVVFLDDGSQQAIEAMFEVEAAATAPPADGGSDGGGEPLALMVEAPGDGGAFPLEGAVLSGEVVASLAPPADIEVARVALDGGAFAEFAGSALLSMPGSPRNPFDTTRLADGEHTLTVEVVLASGETVTLEATFEVRNAGAG